MKRIALFPGSFDPFTAGHLNILKRALTMFDEVVVAVGINGDKSGFFDNPTRMDIINQTCRSLEGVRVIEYSGLTIDICRQLGINHIIRGVRNMIDFETERSIADANRRLAPEIETIIIPTAQEFAHISSSAVRDILRHNGDTSLFMAEGVELPKKMKRLTLIVLLMAASLFKMSAGQVDSTSRARLSEMLEQYYETMLFIDNSEKEKECDYLIESCKDSLVRQFVASSILDHYMNPPLMGEESVAIYLYEKWFLNGPVTIGDEWKAFEASMFYQFNRLSMIDMPAPSLELYDPNGEKCAALLEGSPAVLYFYDTSCAKCKLASTWLPIVMGTVDFPIRLVAIYSGSEEEEWAEFRSKFKIENENVSIIHLWDPEMESDYQMKYGIISTPKIYFIDENCIIRGRRLERDSLEQILNIYKEYYGQVCKKEK